MLLPRIPRCRRVFVFAYAPTTAGSDCFLLETCCGLKCRKLSNRSYPTNLDTSISMGATTELRARLKQTAFEAYYNLDTTISMGAACRPQCRGAM